MRKIVPIIINGVEHKRCSKCGNIKPCLEFYNIRTPCKTCVSKIHKRWREQHVEQMKIIRKKWADEHPEKLKEFYRRWAIKHSNQRSKYGKEWRKQNPNAYKKWRTNNLERARELSRKWGLKHRKYHNNITKKHRQTIKGQLDSRMGNSLYLVLREKKANKTWQSLVGYTTDELKIRIESQFKDGMTWDDLLRGKIHIDHIVPKSKFYYKTADDPEFKVCWGLANLQPLWAQDNRVKHNKNMEEWNKYKEENERTKTS